ncbi:peptidoglycan D,D-transpeptidase FtsI family protein [Horticoccus sp. 23ND18S-11]|uniref:peptidoglycan D,D-transpeptidase FtsI family protein n=1 Tax=Horticoccus sp. 23ND18S-11 TaxID=3391832 RepID=UPI0039C9503C
MSKGFASSYRIVLLATALFLCFAGVGVRLVWLHVVDRDSLIKTIEKARQTTIREVARRGDIVDENGSLLATSSSRRVLGVDPASLRPQDQHLWPQLAEKIDMPEAELRRIFLTRFREPAPAKTATPAAPAPKSVPPLLQLKLVAETPVTSAAFADEDDTDVDPTPDDKGRRAIRWARLREDVPEKLYEEIMKIGIKGVYGLHEYRRVYPNKQLAAHIIGYANRQQEAVVGMEAYADFFLRGQEGWRVGERDGRNRELPQFLMRRVPPSDGYSVKLSINTIVQDIVEQELTYIATTYEPLKASIIVSDPRTGFILAMANYPTFDPNEYNKVPKDEQRRMRNVAVADVYEPGSVFKIVAVAAAIEEGLASRRSMFDCSLNTFAHRGRVLSMPGEDHHFKVPTAVSLAEVVSHSSNRGAAQLGMALGEERFYRYTRAFGFGGTLGFPVGAEDAGLLRPLAKWDPIDITRVPIGHSISATVLQMHQAMSVIANDGVLLRPQIIKEVRDAAGDVVFQYGRTEIRRVVSAETARNVAQLLTGVASPDGTAVGAAIEGYDVAGKTGTTIKLMEEIQADGTVKRVYNRSHHIASFVGFFPAGRPRVAISVVVDDADHKAERGIAYGGKVAAPSFKRIGERLIPILKIESHRAPAHASLIAANQGVRP